MTDTTPNSAPEGAALLANCGRVRLADLCHPGNMRLLAAPVHPGAHRAKWVTSVPRDGAQ